MFFELTLGWLGVESCTPERDVTVTARACAGAPPPVDTGEAGLRNRAACDVGAGS